MSTSVTLNGVSYTIPALADASWGTNVSNYLIAISTACLQKTGGTFTLTAELNLGATYGVKTAYLKTQTANIAVAGWARLAKTDNISWRNNANGADLALAIDSSDRLTFNGALITALALGAANTVLRMNSGGTATEYAKLTTANLDAAAGIVDTQLATIATAGKVSNSATTAASANTASAIVARDGSGNFSAGTITANLTGNASGSSGSCTGNAATVTTNANSTGDVTSVGNATTYAGTVPILKGGTGQTTAAAAFGALSPLTTKGDIQTFSTLGTRLAVGADGLVLTASSAAATGLAWAAGLTTTLADGKILVGNVGNVATAVTPSGDVTITNAGVTAIASGVIVNADVNASAAIDGSKIVSASGATAGVVTGSAQSWNGVKTFSSGINLGGADLTSYIETTASVVFNTGAFTGGSAKTITAVIRRIGKIVTVEFPEISGTTNATNAEMSTSGTPLSAIAPALFVNIPITTRLNTGSNNAGYVQINATGSVVVSFWIDNTTTVASGATLAGYRRFAVTYTLA